MSPALAGRLLTTAHPLSTWFKTVHFPTPCPMILGEDRLLSELQASPSDDVADGWKMGWKL